jgi:hypothetical protein
VISPVVVFVYVLGNCPLCQNDSLPKRSEITWETLESISAVNVNFAIECHKAQRTGPHEIFIPFEAESVVLLVVVGSSLLSETPGHVQSIQECIRPCEGDCQRELLDSAFFTHPSEDPIERNQHLAEYMRRYYLSL